MSDPSRYRFDSVWTVNASPEDAYVVVKDVRGYPHWWKEVKEVTPIDDERYAMRIRAALPYDLRFVGWQATADSSAGVLELGMEGELSGFSRFTVSGGPNHTTLFFEEEVILDKPLLNRLSRVARPALEANHYLMMRHGQSGLRTYLAGYTAGRAKK
jgi:hypothetical protein